MRSPEQVLALYTERKKFYQALHTGMEAVRTVYDGEARVVIPEMDTDDASSVPNLLAQGVDQMAGRIASVQPMASFAPKDPGQRRSERRAQTARQIIHGWWQADRMPLKMKQRARHLIAYGMAPTVISWNPKTERPEWTVRNPLETYPSPLTIGDTAMPTDVIFAYQRTVRWLRANGYGDAVHAVTGNPNAHLDAQMTLLEYHDQDGKILCLVGYVADSQTYDWMIPSSPFETGVQRCVLIEAAMYPEPVMCASVPLRVSLSRPGGQFDAMVGMYYQQSKLMALEVAAVEKGIFPDTYLVSRPNEVGRFLDGPHDGRTGKINVIAGGDIRDLTSAPSYLTNPTIDRIERSQRLTAGIPQEFGGESGSNIRTGRRGDAVLSAVIDFPVAEAQDVLAYGLQDEDKAAIALSKMYGGKRTFQVFVGSGTAAKTVTFVPDEVFEKADHVVSYPAAGTDLNSLMIGLGQRVGMGIMSKETAASLDPFIDSPELEHDRIIAEGLESALVSGIQQQAASGQIPPLVLSKVMTLVASDRMELADALTKVAEDAAKEQAKAAQEQAAQGAPPSAEAMMAPAAAQAMSGSPIPGASQGQTDLASMLNTLRRPTLTIKPMRGNEQGAM